MLNPQILKLMLEMQGCREEEEKNEIESSSSGGSGMKWIKFQSKEYVTVPIKYE